MSHTHKFPEGYLWCRDCEAVTPHEDGHSSWVRSCVICGGSNYQSGCDNCGWTAPEPEELEPMITIHYPGCHCNVEMDKQGLFVDDWAEEVLVDFIRSTESRQSAFDWCYSLNQPIRKYLKSINMFECSCPKVKIYRTPIIFNYQERSIYSMDCMNAMEWSYDTLCPVCGNIFHTMDGNC